MLWPFHHDEVIAIVHPDHVTSVHMHQAVADLQTKLCNEIRPRVRL